MELKSAITPIILSLFVFLSPCSGQTKESANENELSILVLNDTISYYNGSLDNNTKVTTIPFDPIEIKKLVKKFKEKYGDSLRILVKLASEYKGLSNGLKIVEIAHDQKVFTSAFPLTNADKSYFNVQEISWVTPDPFEVTSSSSVTIIELQEFPALMVEMKKDKSVWYRIRMREKDDTVMKKITQPVKENLKKIIAGYNEMIRKENKVGAYFIKGDVSLQYPDVKVILDALKENDVYKFKMGTNDESFMNYPLEENKLDLYMPKDEDDEVKTIPNDSALTLLLLKNNILAYQGDKMFEAKTYDYKNIRQVLMKDVKKYGDKFMVIIKPAEEASYDNSVAILDEMAICNIKRYAMVAPMTVDIELIKKFNSSKGR